mmetsp:Transcript_22006/g.36353  ORF Transcript_22006/g.36353 Transcript_22006/m.36353 type:complete len:824 (+) Transcript_22006:15-2486(+)
MVLFHKKTTASPAPAKQAVSKPDTHKAADTALQSAQLHPHSCASVSSHPSTPTRKINPSSDASLSDFTELKVSGVSHPGAIMHAPIAMGGQELSGRESQQQRETSKHPAAESTSTTTNAHAPARHSATADALAPACNSATTNNPTAERTSTAMSVPAPQRKSSVAEEALKRAAAANQARADDSARKQRDEAAAKQRRAAQDAEWREQLKNMSSTELLGNHLQTKLGVELEAVQAKVAQGKQAVGTIEGELKQVEDELAKILDSKAASIAHYSNRCDTIALAVKHFTSLQEDCGFISKSVKDGHAAAEQKISDCSTIALRITEEFDEAKQRLSKVQANVDKAEEQRAQLLAEVAATEEEAEDALSSASNEASAAALREELGQRSCKLIADELMKQEEEFGKHQRHAAKTARLAEARTELNQIGAKLSNDEASIQKLTTREEALQAEVEAAERRLSGMLAIYDEQMASARRLAAVQSNFVEQGKDKQDEEYLSNLAVVRAQYDTTLKQIDALENDKNAYELCVQEEVEARKGELRSIAKEKQAASASRDERKSYYNEMEMKLEAEAKEEVAWPRWHMEGHARRLAVLKEELASARKAEDKLADAARAAEKARREKSAELEALRARLKARQDALNVQIESERSVLQQQTSYASQLQRQLENTQSSSTPSGLSVRARGVVIIEENDKVMEVQQDKMGLAVEDVAKARERDEAMLKQGESEGNRKLLHLGEQLDATRKAVLMLCQYEKGLEDVLKQHEASPHTTEPPADPADLPPTLIALKSSANQSRALIDDVNERISQRHSHTSTPSRMTSNMASNELGAICDDDA